MTIFVVKMLKLTDFCIVIVIVPCLITRILDSFMNRLNVSLQVTLLCKLFSTLITRKLGFFMDRLNMSLQMT